MATQTSAFKQDDGTWATGRTSGNVKLVDLGTVALYARQSSPLLPPGLLVGIAVRETNRDQDFGGGVIANERDFDVEKNHYSYGIFQLDRGDALATGHPLAAASPDMMLDPEFSCEVFAGRCEGYLKDICSAANLDASRPQDLPVDVWPYLCWAHNAGINGAVASIKKYGLDWGATLARNANEEPDGYVTTRLAPYAAAVLDYIVQYPFQAPSSGNGSLGGDEDTTSAPYDPESSDNPATVSTPFGSFTRYEARRFIILLVVGVVAFVALRKVVRL